MSVHISLPHQSSSHPCERLCVHAPSPQLALPMGIGIYTLSERSALRRTDAGRSRFSPVQVFMGSGVPRCGLQEEMWALSRPDLGAQTSCSMRKRLEEAGRRLSEAWGSGQGPGLTKSKSGLDSLSQSSYIDMWGQIILCCWALYSL